MSAIADKVAMMNYRTKSAVAALAALTGVYGAYFLWAWRPGHRIAEVVAHMIGAAFLTTAIMIALGIAIALDARKRGEAAGQVDERDEVVGLRSTRNGYYSLFALIWCVPFVALAGTSPILLANLCLAMLVTAEAVTFGSRIVYGAAGI